MKSSSGVIIILGGQNDADGNLLSISLERCEQAFQEWTRHPGYLILPTGGFGAHFNTSALPHERLVTQRMIELGIPESAILPGIHSGNTIEDAELAKPVIEQHGFSRIIVVTSDFHHERARHLFEKAFPKHALGMAVCKSDLPADELKSRLAHETAALQRLRNMAD